MNLSAQQMRNKLLTNIYAREGGMHSVNYKYKKTLKKT